MLENAKRIHKMELVAWILVNKYHCILKGGFVRDWIVGGREHFPAGTKLEKNRLNGLLDIIDETVSPKDLDVLLPIDVKGKNIWNADDFIQTLKQYKITCSIDSREGWRNYCIFD